MESYSIPIYGLIGEDFKFTDLLTHLQLSSKYPVLKLLIDSPGGYIDEGDRMLEALKATNKTIICQNTGDVCSKAVDFFILAKKENRFFNPSRGQFLIHNPWTEIEGEGDDLIQAGKELKKLESDAAQRYADATGTDVNIISQFMAENVPLTEEQIEHLGFANIVRPQLQAVALLNNKKSKMDEKVFEEKMNAFDALMLKIGTAIDKILPRAKSLVVADVNGAELDFGAEITDVSQIQVGVKATVGGSPANGKYVMPDGSILVFAEGSLTEIMPAGGDMDALKKENEALKAELETLKSEKSKLEEGAKELQTNISNMAQQLAELKKEYKPMSMDPNTPSKGEGKKEFSFKRKK